MKIIASPEKLQKLIIAEKLKGKKVGLIPTMGALHEGHFSLVKQSLKKCSCTIVSIFVNPTQFGQNEDLDNYPNTLVEDKKHLKALDCDILFLPFVKDMYSKGYNTWVEIKGITEKLCGKSRPVHFRGVTTVVSKLFNICLPDIAFFGQKDYQQCIVIEKMTQELNFPVKIQICPTVRETDGLAMSSRNKYLTGEFRSEALVLRKALLEAKSLINQNERNTKNIVKAMQKIINTAKSSRIDYIEIIDPLTLESVDEIAGKVVIALAVHIGPARLIDNEIIIVSK